MTSPIPYSPPPSKRFTLRDLFVAMTLICVLLAATTWLGWAMVSVGPLIAGATVFVTSVFLQTDYSQKALTWSGGGLIWAVGTGCLFSSIQEPRGPSNRSACINNLKQLSLSIANYESAHTVLPNRVALGSDGSPALSWRVAILPYIEEQPLFKAFKVDEPWNSQSNLPIADRRPYSFACPTSQRAGRSRGIRTTLPLPARTLCGRTARP